MKFIGFAAGKLLIVFCTDEIDGHILINKYKKHTYNVKTGVKSYSYIATHSLNHNSYFMHWKVEVDSRPLHINEYNLKNLLKGHGHTKYTTLVSWINRIEYCAAQTIYNFEK